MQGLYFVFFAIALLVALQLRWHRPRYDISYINLEKDEGRRAMQETQLARIGVPYRRWAGTLGSTLKSTDLFKERVGASNFAQRSAAADKRFRNMGVIGCWLSHVKLLRHLATVPARDYDGHVILEDDVHVPSDLFAHPAWRELPSDWDVLFLGITKPVVGAQVSPHLVRLRSESPDARGNWGTYAYVVRHGSLDSKILPFFKYYLNPFDVQISQAFDDWNVYAVQPVIVKAESEFQDASSIDAQN